jgi:hypothetical protein
MRPNVNWMAGIRTACERGRQARQPKAGSSLAWNKNKLELTPVCRVPMARKKAW